MSTYVRSRMYFRFRVGDAESPCEESSSEDDYNPTPKKVTPKKNPSKPETKKPTPATKSKHGKSNMTSFTLLRPTECSIKFDTVQSCYGSISSGSSIGLDEQTFFSGKV